MPRYLTNQGGTIANAFTLVQETGGAAGNGAVASQLFSLGSAPTLGHLVLVACHMNQTNSPPSSGTGTWQTLLAETTSGSEHYAVYYSVNTTSAGITTNFFTSATGVAQILEFSGNATSGVVDSTPALATGTSATPTTNSINPTTDAELLLAIFFANSTITLPSGWLTTTERSGNGKFVRTAYLKQGAAAALSPAAAIASGTWGAKGASINHL